MLIGIVGWVMLGLVTGFISTKMVNLHGDDPGIGIGVGALGAVAGGILYSMISGKAIIAFSAPSLFFAAVAAVAILLGWYAWRSRSASR